MAIMPAATPPPPQPARTRAEEARLIRLWTEAEKVAMHFNELLLTFRLKAIGAVTVGAGLFGGILLTRDNASAPRVNYVVFAYAMWFLAAVWLAIFSIDAGYYGRLLRGAVKEAIRFEKASDGLIRLSTVIEEEVRSRWPRRFFYLIPFVAFVVAGGLAYREAPAEPAAPDRIEVGATH